jgi:GT2 family glycosyltransferase
MSVCVSVIVPTYRRPDLLRRLLEALFAQDILERYEILVVDDAPATRGMTSARHCWVNHSGANSCLRYLRTRGGQGPAAARNLGVHAARGEIVAFTDDDCVPEPDWLRYGVAALAGGAEGASGRVIISVSAMPTDYERNAARLEASEFVTANCFYRRSVIVGAGGFDERFRLAWREDTDLHFTLLERGARLVHARDAVVTHPIRPAPWGVSLSQQRKSQYNALLYRKHPRLYRERVQPAPPWRYYMIVGALFGGAVNYATRHRRLAAACSCLWFFLTLRFCLSRLRATSRAPIHLAEMAVTSALIPPLSIYWRLRGAIRFRTFFL